MRVHVYYRRRPERYTIVGVLCALLVCVPWTLFVVGRAVYETVRTRRSREMR